MSAPDTAAHVSRSDSVKPVEESPSQGLTSGEAQSRLEKDGPNAMPDTSAHLLRDALANFWASVPWLLEASIVLEFLLHKVYEAAVIASLLVINAALAYFQERRAQATLSALKSRLAVATRCGTHRLEQQSASMRSIRGSCWFEGRKRC
jgi:H+-transporting ATPase